MRGLLHKLGEVYEPQHPRKSGRSGLTPHSSPSPSTHSQGHECRCAQRHSKLKLKMLYQTELIFTVKAEYGKGRKYPG